VNIVLLGPPGCGKGTQGAILAERLGSPKIATGDLLRQAVKDATPLGTKAKAYMDQGLLVPDAVIIGLIKEVLSSPAAAHGVIMDGFPRTVAQAEAVETLLGQTGREVDRVLGFNATDEELVSRLLGRAETEGRSDDTEKAIQRRLEVYRDETAPLIDYYRKSGVLVEIDAVGAIDAIAERIRGVIGA
jgi:adenylate kinase